jgi:hypothetical protein
MIAAAKKDECPKSRRHKRDIMTIDSTPAKKAGSRIVKG